MIEQTMIDNWFTYHSPTEDQIPLYAELRQAAKAYAEVANRVVPDGADKTAAMRSLRTTNMAFHQAIACHQETDYCTG